MAKIEPIPTYAEIIVQDNRGKGTFNPIWLKWFLDLAAAIGVSTGTTIGVQGNPQLQNAIVLVQGYNAKLSQSGQSITIDALARTPVYTGAVTTYTQLATAPFVVFDITAGCTVTMLAPASYPGMIAIFKNTAAFAVVSGSSNICPLGSKTAGTAILPASAGSSVLMVSDGTNWVVMN